MPSEPATQQTPDMPATGPAPPSAGQIARRLGPAGPLAVVSAVMPALGGFWLLWHIQQIGEWLRARGPSGVALYAAGFAAMAGLALLPTYAQAVLGGWAFGMTIGFSAALAGFGGGALIGYELGRRASGDRVVRLIEEQPRWRAVVDSLVHSGFGKTFLIVTLLRLPPNSPFAITNLVLSSTKVARLPYLLGTLVGMAPRTALAVYIGVGIRAGLNPELTGEGIASAKRQFLFWGIGAAVAVVLIIGQLAKKALEKVSAPAA